VRRRRTSSEHRNRHLPTKENGRRDESAPVHQSLRRRLLKSAVVGITAAGIGAWTSAPALARETIVDRVASGAAPTATSVGFILDIARTFEQLAVVFYSHVLANAEKLGLDDDSLHFLQAVLVEEQLHQQYFAQNGGHSLADAYSFPHGPQTFTDMPTFIATQQMLEEVFDSAFLAAVFEFAVLGHPNMAQVAGQIATIEAEHRALGRTLAGAHSVDNWAFTPVTIGSVSDVPAVMQKLGFWSPGKENTYTYQPVSTVMDRVQQRVPYSRSIIDLIGRG
jgi:hypothetical protein